jgi:vacuolar protein sorting-associated protein 41
MPFSCCVCKYADSTVPFLQLGNLPELRVMSRAVRDKPQLLSSDALSIHEFERCKSTDYRLAYIQSENIFYIVSPKDIVVARPPDLDDHISWLIGVERYEQALAEARGRERELRTHKISEIGQKFLDYLLDSDFVDQAAEQCANLLGNDVALWENWVYKFEEKNSLRAIAAYVPTRSPQLSSKLYEIILSAFVDEDAAGFLKLIEKWPPAVYKLAHIVTKVSHALEKERDQQRQKDLTLALSKLFIFDRQYDKALDLYLRLGLDAFDLINQHGLEHFPSIGQRVLSFMRLSAEKATQLLSANIRWIPVEHVVKQLEPEPRLQLKYLHQLFLDKRGDEIKQFYDLQITLYAEHDVDNLAEFLEKSTTLSITNLDRALELCSKKKLWSEMVWILGKMGNTQEALELMIDKVGDVKQAIEFVQKQDDPELWDDLIKRSITNPVFVSGLLENVGTHINPLTLIDKIPRGMEIIGLRDRLVKIIYDYNLQTTLKEGCTEVLKADCKFLADKLIMGLRRGMKVDTSARCPTCSLLVGDTKQQASLVVFFCGHTYHQKCLSAAAAAQQQAPSPAGARKLNNSAGPASASPSAALAKTAEMAVDKGLFCGICRQTSAQDKRPTKRAGVGPV